MMNWFKENKFIGGLLLVTALVAGLLIYLGLSTADKRDTVAAEVATQKESIRKMKSMDLFPTIESVAKKKANLKSVVGQAELMQKHFMSFRPESLENITVSLFSDRLKKSDADIRAVFEEKEIKIPDFAYLGFEQYKGALPRNKATGIISYELSAIEWLFSEFAEAGISEVVNFKREALPPEAGAEWDTGLSKKNTQKGKKKGKSKRQRSASKESLVAVAKRLPMEVTLEGSEESIRQVLQAIANSEKFFFETSAYRLKNNAAVPSSKGIRTDEEDEDDFSDDEFGAAIEEEEQEEAPLSGKILQRVAGGNDIAVFVRLDLLLFEDALKFPVIK